MSITKESLHTLVDIIDESEYEILFRLLMKFVPVDMPYEDEVEALEIARQQIENNEVYSFDELENL